MNRTATRITMGSGLALLVALGLWAGLKPEVTPLPLLGRVPAFRFTRETGAPFGSEDLAGRPWIANFIFTRCPTICPVFTRTFAGVQKRTAPFGPHLSLVSFSVDPAYDTPERLKAYAEQHGADPSRWRFLTGDYALLKDTVVGGFKVSMGRENADEDDLLALFHGTHFVLVDETGEIRGYYASDDAAAVDRLVKDAERLTHD